MPDQARAADQALQDTAFKARSEDIDGISIANVPVQYADQIKRMV